jgi:hypothetical protein
MTVPPCDDSAFTAPHDLDRRLNDRWARRPAAAGSLVIVAIVSSVGVARADRIPLALALRLPGWSQEGDQPARRTGPGAIVVQSADRRWLCMGELRHDGWPSTT